MKIPEKEPLVDAVYELQCGHTVETPSSLRSAALGGRDRVPLLCPICREFELITKRTVRL